MTLQEKLGYAKNAKLLIIHADDMGLSHSENRATIEAMERGIVNSGSIMVPCPWFPEAADYARIHPGADIGLHLTLNSEWKYYRWKSILSSQEVSTLLDDQGFLHNNRESFMQNAKGPEVEMELRAQIERGLAFGVNPTHLDSHMFALLSKPKYIEVYLKLGREYKLPLLLNKALAKSLFDVSLDDYIRQEDILVDHLFMAFPEHFQKGLKHYYTEILQAIQPGLNVILLHTAYDDHEMQGITVDHPDWGSIWRQQDFSFFTSRECQNLIKEERIQLITWREIRDKLILN